MVIQITIMFKLEYLRLLIFLSLLMDEYVLTHTICYSADRSSYCI